MATVRVVEYVDRAGWSPYGKWFESLNAAAAAKVATAVYQVAAAMFRSITAARMRWDDYRRRRA